MPISRENVPQQTGNTTPHGNGQANYPSGALSSRPSGIAGNLPSSRPTGISNDYTPNDSTQDEMMYGRIIRTIRANPKR